MPIYEYECTSCGHQFERLMKISADAPPCPECGEEVRKRVSASGFILKGGGWYKDHYGLKSGGSGSSGSSPESKSTSTGDAKASTSSGDSSSSTPAKTSKPATSGD